MIFGKIEFSRIGENLECKSGRMVEIKAAWLLQMHNYDAILVIVIISQGTSATLRRSRFRKQSSRSSILKPDRAGAASLDSSQPRLSRAG